MLEFEASYLPFESLRFCVIYDNHLHNTPSLPFLPSHLIKFCIRAEFLDTKLLVFTLLKLPEQKQMQKYIYGNFSNFNPQATVNTSCRKNNTLQNGAFYQTALCTSNY